MALREGAAGLWVGTGTAFDTAFLGGSALFREP